MLSSLLSEIHQVSKLHQRCRDEVSRSERQSRARWEVLAAIAGGSGGTVPQVARALGRSRQSIQRLVDLLAEEGALQFDPNPAHKRSPLLRPTERGLRIRERLDRDFRDWESSAGELLEREDVETALLVLRGLRAALESRR